MGQETRSDGRLGGGGARACAPDFLAALSVAAEPEAFTAACLALLADDRLAGGRGAALLDMQKAHYSRAGAAPPRLQEGETRPARAGRR